MTASTPVSQSKKNPVLIPRNLIFPFALVTTLFALWGFANDVTNPLVKAFKDVFVISNAQSSLVQTAFYGGYATMALPAALFIRRFTYKAGIIVGLALYATGALISIPAAANINFNLFLVALYVLTFGLAFLETTANPFVLSMGPQETATRRLNLAQAFNPIGSLTGMTVASLVILSNLQVSDYRADVQAFHKGLNGEVVAGQVEIDPVLGAYLEGREVEAVEAGEGSLGALPYDTLLDQSLRGFKAGEFESFQGASFQDMQQHDLDVVKLPYVVIGMVVIGVMLVFVFFRMPDTGHDKNKSLKLVDTFGRLFTNKSYVEGVFAQTFYVGAQIMCWTFIIHYATTNLGMSAARAQNYNIIAMAIFCGSRFICTFVLKYIRPGRLLMILATGGILTTLGTIFLSGMPGLYCLIGISACMSLMFPTIYGIALDGMGEDAKIASAGLIFAIVGGALMPPLQGRIIDLGGEAGTLMGLPVVSASFVLPLLCFVFIAFYGWRTFTVHEKRGIQGAL
ncbi:MAG: L-fucose:H+ symporter permease [Gammaproteobacteria bacterium]|nr:MAG: L-fucose:H+ symporter permease [Gammaproteobacteria bacterium]